MNFSESRLLDKITLVARRANLTAAAVAVYDFQSSLHFNYQVDRWFHAASTMKLGVLFALFKATDDGRISLEDRLHVRNRFRSVVDGSPYRLESNRDGDSEVYTHIGRRMRMLDLAEAMIVRSSNLATNLLIDFMGIAYIQEVLQQAGLHGLLIVRGVEDHLAYQRGINNQVTAQGLLDFFKLLHGTYLTEMSRVEMLSILLNQQFNRMIPALLPSKVKVAHKTGEISTVCHDAGLIILPDREPYILVILTEFPSSHTHRAEPLAEISLAVYEELVSRQETVKVI